MVPYVDMVKGWRSRVNCVLFTRCWPPRFGPCPVQVPARKVVALVSFSLSFIIIDMASISRYPFATRLQPSQSLGPLDVAPRSVSGTKRPHSPEPTNEAPKRHRASHNLSTAAALAQRERKQQDRQDKAQREAEFRDKYTRAFPAFIFYFDTESMQTELSLKAALQSRVDQLGAVRVLVRVGDVFTHALSPRPAKISSLNIYRI